MNLDTKDLLKKIRWKTKEFNVGGYGGFYGMLYCQKVGLVDSWAVRYYASSFLANKLVLFPGQSLALQNGMDGKGTHSENIHEVYNMMHLASSPILLEDIPVEENEEMYAAFSRYYKGGQKVTLKGQYKRLKSFVRRLIGIDYW